MESVSRAERRVKVDDLYAARVFVREHGKRVFGVLLFQDLAVIPYLVLIPALARADANWLSQLGMAMLKAATSAFMPGGESRADSAGQEEAGESKDELAALREQMAEMQRKLDALGK